MVANATASAADKVSTGLSTYIFAVTGDGITMSAQGSGTGSIEANESYRLYGNGHGRSSGLAILRAPRMASTSKLCGALAQ